MDNLTSQLKRAAREYPPLLWALRSKQLYFADRISLSIEERLTLMFAMLAFRSGSNLVIEHPRPNPRLAMAATAGLLLADFAARHGTRQNMIRDDLLFVTRQVGLALADLSEIKIERVDIPDVWEVIRASSAPLVRGHGRPRLLVSSPRPGFLLPYQGSVGAVVVDASHPLTLERLPDILTDPVVSSAPHKIVIIPLGFSSQADYLSNWPTWCWSIPNINTDYETANSQGHTCIWQRDFLVCTDDETDKHLAKAREKLVLLSRGVGQSIPYSLLSAWGLYNRLASLPVSLGIYEEHATNHPRATTLRRKLDNLRREIPPQYVSDKYSVIWASEWHPLVESLSATYEALKGGEPAKFWAIASVVEEYISDGFSTPLIIVCPTEIEGNLLIKELSYVCTDLSKHLHPEALSVTTPRALAGHPDFFDSQILSVGSFTSRWRFLHALLRTAKVTLYPHEIESEKAHVSWIIHQIREKTSWNAQTEAFADLGIQSSESSSPASIPSLVFSNLEVDFHIDMPVNAVRQKATLSENKPLDEILVPSWAWDAEDITYVPPISIAQSHHTDHETDTDAIELIIYLNDDKRLFTSRDQVFDVYRRITDEIEERMAEQLMPGDILLLIHDSNYSRLFDRIVEALEARPEYALLSIWLSLWETAKSSALESCNSSFSHLHDTIIKCGVSITEQAVRSWFSGTMAPRDDEILFRLLDISGNQAAIAHKAEIRATLGHIRGARRQLGRQMRQFIKSAATADDPKGLINSPIDLAVEDVLAAAQSVVVEKIEFVS